MANERYILIRPPQLPELDEVGAGAYVVGYDTATDRTVKINVSALGGGSNVDINWRSNVTYEQDNIVEYGLKLWKSLVDDNLGIFPSESTQWTEVARAGSGSNITNYAPGVYTFNPTIVIRNDKLYKLFATLPFESTDFDAELTAFKWRRVNDTKLIGVAYGVGMTGNYTFENLDDTLLVLKAGSINSIKAGTTDLTISVTEPSYIIRTGAGNTLADFTIIPLGGKANLVYIFDAETAGNDIGLQIPVGGVILFYHNAGGFRWIDDQGATLHNITLTEPSIISRTGAGVTFGDLTIAPIGGSATGGHVIQNAAGDNLPAQDALQFGAGFTVTDETGKTVVGIEYVQPISFAITDTFTFKPACALSITSADVSSNITDLRVGKNGDAPVTITYPYAVLATDILIFEVTFTDAYDRELNSFITLIGQYL